MGALDVLQKSALLFRFNSRVISHLAEKGLSQKLVGGDVVKFYGDTKVVNPAIP